MPDAVASTRDQKIITRLEAFSDGVIAIIITLLVFSIQVPDSDTVDEVGLLRALLDEWPTLLAFTVSFFFILVMWINHHRLFLVIRRADNGLLLWNGLLLFGISLVPFPTAVVAQYLNHAEQASAVLVYNGLFLLIAMFFNLLWRHASAGNRLFDANTDKVLVAHISRQYAFGPVLYGIALLLVLVSPWLSLALNVGLAVFFALPNKAVSELIDSAPLSPSG
jgi:uncharacterized membrane protein